MEIRVREKAGASCGIKFKHWKCFIMAGVTKSLRLFGLKGIRRLCYKRARIHVYPINSLINIYCYYVKIRSKSSGTPLPFVVENVVLLL